MAVTKSGLSRRAINDGDRQLRRTCTRFGEEIRAIRLRSGVSQAALGRAIGVTRSVICRMEQGATDVSPRIRARAAAVLGADVRIAIYPSGTPLIHDAAHARIVESVIAAADRRWQATVESPVPGPGRRSTDIRLDLTSMTVLLEIETRVHGLESIIRECSDKRVAVMEASPRDHRVHVVLVLPATAHHRALEHAHPAIFKSAFPAASSDVAAALANVEKPWPGDGILWTTALRRQSA